MEHRIFLVIIIYFWIGLSFPVQAQNWDINILKSINPNPPSSLFWQQTSSSAFYVTGATAVGQLFVGIVNDDQQVRQRSFELFISVGVSTLISESLKRAINRERPADRYPDEIFVSSPLHGRSFPSGHATLAFNTATTIALDYKKWYVVVPAYLWAGSVGYSRMYLGRHYPSDVIGGAAVGIGSGVLSHWLTQRIFKPYNKTHQNE